MGAARNAKTTSLLQVKSDKIKKSYNEHLKIDARSQEALYATLAEVYGFARMALETANRAEFEVMAKYYGMSTEVGADDNPYLPVTKTLFNEQKVGKSGKVSYVALAVAYKYAKAIRHLMENGVDEKKVVQYITDFKYTPKRSETPKTKLAAIYIADTEAHPEEKRGAAERTEKKKDNLVKDLVKEDTLSSFTIPTGKSYHTFEGFTILVGDVDGRTVNVRKLLNCDDDTTKRVFMLFAEKEEKKPTGTKTMWDDPKDPGDLITAEDADGAEEMKEAS